MEKINGIILNGKIYEAVKCKAHEHSGCRNCMDYPRDNETPKIHPTQKSAPLLMRLIEIFTDPGDVVIDPCAGSGTTLRAAAMLNRRSYGFEIKKDFCREAELKILSNIQQTLFV